MAIVRLLKVQTIELCALIRRDSRSTHDEYGLGHDFLLTWTLFFNQFASSVLFCNGVLVLSHV